MTPRVRFAPSPTGYLHVGGARTALFNWLYARRYGGVFILRVEDTDVERSSEEMVAGILESMRWLGLDWDEGPFFQTRRLALYREAAQRALDAGRAFRCFCRAAAGERSLRDPCRAIPPAEAAGRVGEPAAIRFRTPDDGVTAFADAVFGPVEFANTELEDFVLLRSDGMPTYHLSCVADDLAMQVTHVIRGADHLSNTPKQVLLYQALGKPQPVFAHVPLILGPDKTRLSKRHGATAVTAYKDLGLLPEAFRNFLALLGWGPGDNREVLSTAELIAAFSLEGISRSNAVFNTEKMEWFNQQYIQRYSAAELLPHVSQELANAGLPPPSLAAIDLLKSRMRTLKDFSTTARAYFSDDFPIDGAAAAKFWRDPALKELLPALAEALGGAATFDAASSEAALRAFAESRGVKAGLLINAARVALTGQAVAPSLFEVMAYLGREKTVARLRRSGVTLGSRTAT
jgi:glutamyl-tRNA synthetase